MKNKDFRIFKEKLFSRADLTVRPLVVFEMANNHMGSVAHGLKIIRSHAKVAQNFNFNYAFKFQFRTLDSYIHPDYKSRMDIPYVKRFSETKLEKREFKRLKKEVDKFGFVTMCTPFDEAAVDLIEELDFNIIKVASAACTDWPLLERIVKSNKPIIVSLGGTGVKEIDRIVSFLFHREKQFALMHCVGEYPTQDDHLELNQIDFLKGRYPNIVIGFSTHEKPDVTVPVQIAVAKGARILEKHVSVKTKKFAINAYSSTPKQVKGWLTAASSAITMSGVTGKRPEVNEKEQKDLTTFRRGVFAKNDIPAGKKLQSSDLLYAFPNVPTQILANDMSKYSFFTTKHAIKAKSPILSEDVVIEYVQDEIWEILKKVKEMVTKANVLIPSGVDLEISHHYGVSNFYKFGATLVNIVNREYCKKLIIMLPGQVHPTQFHKKKEETFHVMYGVFSVKLNGKKHLYNPGDVVTILPEVRHEFVAPKGGVLEEISTTHYVDDSFYEDEKINTNKSRKTYIAYWAK